MDDVGLIAFPWNPSLETGRGHDTYAYHLLNHLSQADLNFKVFPIVTIRHLQNGVNKFDYLAKEASFLSKILNSKSGTYHGISPLGAKTAILANKKPVITTIHDVIPFIHHRDIRQAYERLCIKLCCQKSKRIIVSSKFTKDFLEKTLEFDSSKVSIVRYGVDHSIFKHHKKSLSKKKIVFSVLRWGDLDQVFRIFRSIKKEIPTAFFVLGLTNSFDKWREMQIPHLLREFDLQGSVGILNNVPVSELSDYYNAADVYISPSVGGFSLTLLEAMACGTPVVAFDLLDVAEYVGSDGVLVKPNDFQGLADETIKLLLNEKLRNNLSKRSIEKSLCFSWKKMTEETIAVYHDVLGC